MNRRPVLPLLQDVPQAGVNMRGTVLAANQVMGDAFFTSCYDDNGTLVIDAWSDGKIAVMVIRCAKNVITVPSTWGTHFSGKSHYLKGKIMNPSKTLASMLAASLLIVGLAACQKKEEVTTDKGPAETAGQKIDEAAADASRKADEAGNKMSEEAAKAKAEMSQGAANMQDATGKKLEETGEKMQESAKDNK